MADDESSGKVKETLLPKVTRSTKWEPFEEDSFAHLEVCGLDSAWDSDEAPSDTEPDLYPDAKTAAEIVAEVAPHAAYRSKVTGLRQNTEAAGVTSNMIAVWARAVR